MQKIYKIYAILNPATLTYTLYKDEVFIEINEQMSSIIDDLITASDIKYCHKCGTKQHSERMPTNEQNTN